MTSHPNPTLTLQIPFHLLGRYDLPDDQKLQPLETVYTVLSQICKDLPIIREPNEPFPPECWIVSSAPSFSPSTDPSKPSTASIKATDNFVLPGWREGDAVLSPKEKELLGDNIWTFPIVLRRIGIPILSFSSPEHPQDVDILGKLGKEIEEICAALRKEFMDYEDQIEGGKGKRKRWGLAISRECWLSVAVVGGVVEENVDDEHGGGGCRRQQYGLDISQARNLCLLRAGFDHELTILGTPGSLARFWGFGRFFEYGQVRGMAEEIRKQGMRPRDREMWINEVQDRIEKWEGDEGGRMTLWEVVDNWDVEGEQGVWSWLREMRRFEVDKGKRLAMSFILGNEVDQNGASEIAHRSEEKKEILTGNSDVDSLPSNPVVPSSGQPISSVIFQGFRSTLDPQELLAITSVVYKLTEMALEDYKYCMEKLIDSKETQRNNPLEAFSDMLVTLEVKEETNNFWWDNLKSLYSEFDGQILREDQQRQGKQAELQRESDQLAVAASKSEPMDTANEHSILNDPFLPLLAHLNEARAREKACTPLFLSRLASVDGFYPASFPKLYSLLSADKQSLKRKRTEAKKNKSEADA